MTKELDFTPGRWAIVADAGTYIWEYKPTLCCFQIESATAKVVKAVSDSGKNFYGKQAYKADVLGTWPEKESALKLVQASEGLNEEMERRITAARDWAQSAVSKLLEQSQ